MILFSRGDDPACHCVRIVVVEKGLDVRIIEVDPARPPEDLIDLNPYQSVPTLVDRESLASALAINSVIFNLARFIGPALAGIVIAEIGIAAAFAANAVSYIAFQISLLNLRGLPPPPVVARQNVLRLTGANR